MAWIAPSGRPNGAVGAAARAEAAAPGRALGVESRLEYQLGGGEETGGWPKRELARRLRRDRFGAFWSKWLQRLRLDVHRALSTPCAGSRNPKTAKRAALNAQRSPTIIMTTYYALTTMTKTHHRTWPLAHSTRINRAKYKRPAGGGARPQSPPCPACGFPSPSTAAHACLGGCDTSRRRPSLAGHPCPTPYRASQERAGPHRRHTGSPPDGHESIRSSAAAHDPPPPPRTRAGTRKRASSFNLPCSP